jgi:hypothetical protein
VRSVIADDVGKIFYGYKDKEGQHVGGFATKFSRCIGKTTSNGIEITEANWLIYGTRGLWLQTWKEPLQSLCQKIDALKNISKPE